MIHGRLPDNFYRDFKIGFKKVSWIVVRLEKNLVISKPIMKNDFYQTINAFVIKIKM
jgi:hypothetical protein